MTLIATVISRHGIIQASDSNLTSNIPGDVTTGPKIFDLGFVPGALALAGTYAVGHESMDTWLTAFIEAYANAATPSLAGFAQELATALESSTDPDKPRLFHIAGYEVDLNGSHPAFYFVRNIGGIDHVTGDYKDFTPTYLVTEDFWSRDFPQMPPETFTDGEYFRYFNGFPSGRIAFLGASQLLQDFYEHAWSRPEWKFRRPDSLEEIAAFTRLDLEVVNTLFLSSDYPSHYIGGQVQLALVPRPA